MNLFKSALIEELTQSQSNNFGIENFDQHRFGKMPDQYIAPTSFFYLLKQSIKKIIGYDKLQKQRAVDETLRRAFEELKKYEDGLEYLFQHVGAESKDIIVKVIAFRLLGFVRALFRSFPR